MLTDAFKDLHSPGTTLCVLCQCQLGQAMLSSGGLALWAGRILVLIFAVFESSLNYPGLVCLISINLRLSVKPTRLSPYVHNHNFVVIFLIYILVPTSRTRLLSLSDK